MEDNGERWANWIFGRWLSQGGWGWNRGYGQLCQDYTSTVQGALGTQSLAQATKGKGQ
jgi:hypothetical protein